MRGNHSARPVHSFLSLFGFERRSPSPSHQLRSSSANNDAHAPTSSHEPPQQTHQYHADTISPGPSPIQIQRLTPVHVSPQPTFADPPSFKHPPASSGDQLNLISPSRQSQEAIATTRINIIPEGRPSGTVVTYNEQNPRPSPWNPGMFYQAHDFVFNDPVFVDNSADNFMASFLKETIPGAEFDSSDANMPLRCHPGTRLEIIKRCQDFILNREGRPKLRWVVGTAGVGKSAIMQSIAQDEHNVLSNVIIGATIFFSINGRQDGTKAIPTIAYQLSVKLDSYRLFVQHEVTRDPSLFRKSLSRQFNLFIIEPFIRQRILDSSSHLLIIIDGLDECANPVMQQELLGLISNFCTTYPTSPIVWMIASRPEPHITSFFSQPKVALSYEKEEILVDSDDAHEDVKRYLRDKFREIRMASISLQFLAQWPSESDLLNISNASGGLFAYASTVVRYISDPNYGDPISLLHDVLRIIETGTVSSVSGEAHPMAHLDALYAHIMSRIPAKIMANTRKLLLLCLDDNAWLDNSFRFHCNMLGMTQHLAYGATHHICSIAIIPGPAEAGRSHLDFFHKSFPDYLRDFKRSGFSPNIELEAEQLRRQCGLRILKEAPDGVYMDGIRGYDSSTGFRNGPGTGDNIFVAWPGVGEQSDRETRLNMFREAVWEAVEGLRRREKAFQSLLCMRVLTTCFAELPELFPFDAVRDFVFNKSRRRQLLRCGVLKQVPLETVDYDAITIRRRMRLCFKGPTTEPPKPWNESCEHEREGSWGDLDQDWSTEFIHPDVYEFERSCSYCFRRFTQHLKTRLPGHVVTVLDLTPTLRWVELRFVGLADEGEGEWIYLFFTGEDDQYDDRDDEGDGDDGENSEDGNSGKGKGRDSIGDEGEEADESDEGEDKGTSEKDEDGEESEEDKDREKSEED